MRGSASTPAMHVQEVNGMSHVDKATAAAQAILDPGGSTKHLRSSGGASARGGSNTVNGINKK